ncbi:flagellar hook-length control protein FliK [Alkalihalobacillus hemicentroti]|uniref:Flagellar hook-length control protein FliK n=2 Tax=Guptibacillus hwajinpoensis TaxID=208199 RepID=A0ABU0K0M1_9BACL|nr:flagellar hook-length control protein FliK [Alkalihalobacillus hemicentroti]
MKTMIQPLGAPPAQPVKAKAAGDATGFAQLLTNVMETIETIQPESQPQADSNSSEKQPKEEQTVPFNPLLTLANLPAEQTSKPLPSSKGAKEASEANEPLNSLLAQMNPEKGKPSEIKLPGFIKSELLKLDPDVEQLVKLANSKTVPVEELKTAIAKVMVENNETLTKKDQSNLLATLKSSEGVTSKKDPLAAFIQKVEIRQGTGEQLETEAKQPAESLPQPEMEPSENLEPAKAQVDDLPSLPQMKTSEAPQSLVKESNAPVPVRQVSTSISDMILERMQVMKNGDESQIRIKLSPENLGQLDIRLTTSDGKLTAFIATATSAAKEMIESQLHQLRQTLVQQGVQLDKVEVIQQPSSPSSSMMQDGRSHQGQQFDQGKQHRGERRDEYEVDDNPLITQEKEEENSGINYAV